MERNLAAYSDILSRLVSETVACTPQEWTAGKLTVDCDGKRLDYKLKNDQQPGLATISDKLRTLIEELYVRMSRAGDTWVKAVLNFTINGKDVKFQTSFEYTRPTTGPAAPSTPTTPPKKKPWWQFGK